MKILKRIGGIKINLARLLTFLSRQISFSFSPLVKELVRFDDDNQDDKDYSGQLRLLYSNLKGQNKVRRSQEEHWIRYLTRPLQCAQLIKTYHSVGNLFFVSVFFQLGLLTHLCIKCVFHQLYTQDDNELADYLASNYYPRLYHSYEKPHELYGSLTAICTFHLILRLRSFLKLVRNSVVNQNGYKEIETSQLDYFFYTLILPINEWIRVVKEGLRHSSICRTVLIDDEKSRKERIIHLRAGLESLDSLGRLKRQTQRLCLNPISFVECFRHLGFDTDERRHLGDNIYLLESDCRADVWEFAWFVFFHSVGGLILCLAIVYVISLSTLKELVHLTSNQNEATLMDCLLQVPNLIGDPINLIRLIDVQFLLIVQLPYQFEANTVYFGLSCIISRTRRLVEIFEHEFNFCKAKYEAQIRSELLSAPKNNLQQEIRPSLNRRLYYAHARDYELNMSISERIQLNQRLEQSLRLSKVLKIEFIVMKNSLTSYLNILMIGSGIVMAVGLLCFIRVESSDTRIFLILGLTSCTYPILNCAIMCALVERGVSSCHLKL